MDKETKRILREIDVKAAMQKVLDNRGFSPSSEEVALAAIHKARVIVGSKLLTDKEIAESIDWLQGNGYEVPIFAKILSPHLFTKH